MLIEIYKAWFFTGQVKVAIQVWGFDSDHASNNATERAMQEGWSFLGTMDHLGTLNLERCLELSL